MEAIFRCVASVSVFQDEDGFSVQNSQDKTRTFGSLRIAIDRAVMMADIAKESWVGDVAFNFYKQGDAEYCLCVTVPTDDFEEYEGGEIGTLIKKLHKQAKKYFKGE